jgi:hypothetical protein
MEAIEKELNADPDERLRMIQARLLASGLDDMNSRKRAEAREQMLALGRAALPTFLSVLAEQSGNARWQAAKALSGLHDPETAADLTNALDVTDFGVQWLAAEGLIAMGPACLESLLKGLSLRFSSTRMREGAHHVLHVLVDSGFNDETLEKLLHVLEGYKPGAEVAWATEQALEKIRRKKGAEGLSSPGSPTDRHP